MFLIIEAKIPQQWAELFFTQQVVIGQHDTSFSVQDFSRLVASTFFK